MRHYKRIKGTKVYKTITKILATHHKLRNCYMWQSPRSASQRRYMEVQHSEDLHFVYKGKEYEITQTTSCSCKNIYYRLQVVVDGTRKDVRALYALHVDLPALFN